MEAIERDENQITIKQDKDMILKQLRLIEMRRMELMQRKSVGGGGYQQQQQQQQQQAANLNPITNQHWDVIGEYVPKASNKYGDNLQLDLSSDSSGDRKEDGVSSDAETSDVEEDKKSIRKALMINENENETTSESEIPDDNKENNQLYPSLKKLSAVKKERTKSNGKKSDSRQLYPSLDGYGNKYESQALQYGMLL